MPELISLAGIALKTSLLIGAAGMLSIALRRQSAAFRHLLWTSTLALCGLMPLAVLYLPSFSLVTVPMDLSSSLPSPATGGGSGWDLLIWIIGCSIVLMRELLASIGLARWRRQARPLTSARWTATLARISATCSFDCSRVRVLESNHLASPCMWGVLRPVLLLPAAGDAWPESARRSALLHELAHVRRRDTLSTLISRLACALHWYNPLVWLAAARVRTLQERACDDSVIRSGAVPSEYAQFLVDVAAHTSGIGRAARAAIGMTHGSSLRTRIVAILDPEATREQPQRSAVFAAYASLLGVMIFLATASVAAPPPPVPEPPILATPPTLPVPPVRPVPPTLPTPPVSPI